jgi:hypothetical protein
MTRPHSFRQVDRLYAVNAALDEQASEVLDRATPQLACSKCGAVTRAACHCGVAYLSPGERAAIELVKDPSRSDRMIAEAIGVDPDTVARARKTTAGNPAVERVGRDGKSRRLPTRRNGKADPVGTACDIDWEHHKEQEEAVAEARARGAAYQMHEGLRLAEEFRLLERGVRPSEIKAKHIRQTAKVATAWRKLNAELKRRRRGRLAP